MDCSNQLKVISNAFTSRLHMKRKIIKGIKTGKASAFVIVGRNGG